MRRNDLTGTESFLKLNSRSLTGEKEGRPQPEKKINRRERKTLIEEKGGKRSSQKVNGRVFIVIKFNLSVLRHREMSGGRRG